MDALTAKVVALTDGQAEFFYLQSVGSLDTILMLRSVPSEIAFSNFIAEMKSLNGAIRASFGWVEFSYHHGLQKMFGIFDGYRFIPFAESVDRTAAGP